MSTVADALDSRIRGWLSRRSLLFLFSSFCCRNAFLIFFHLSLALQPLALSALFLLASRLFDLTLSLSTFGCLSGLNLFIPFDFVKSSFLGTLLELSLLCIALCLLGSISVLLALHGDLLVFSSCLLHLLAASALLTSMVSQSSLSLLTLLNCFHLSDNAFTLLNTSLFQRLQFIFLLFGLLLLLELAGLSSPLLQLLLSPALVCLSFACLLLESGDTCCTLLLHQLVLGVLSSLLLGSSLTLESSKLGSRSGLSLLHLVDLLLRCVDRSQGCFSFSVRTAIVAWPSVMIVWLRSSG